MCSKGFDLPALQGLPYRILNINHEKEIQWSLWARADEDSEFRVEPATLGLWVYPKGPNTLRNLKM